MPSRGQYTFLLLALISSIYLLRDSNTSPGTFLKKHITRQLKGHQITEAFCQGTSQENDITQSEKDTTEDHIQSLAKKRHGNPLIEFIEGPSLPGEIDDEYVKPIMKAAIPFFIIFFISFVVCIYFITVWCCTSVKWCPKLAICSGPKPGGYRVPIMISAVVFSGLLVVTALVGVVVSTGVRRGGHKLLCSTGVFIEKLLEGSPTEDWVGVEQTLEDFTVVLDDFYPMVGKLTLAPSLTTTTLASGMVATLTTAELAVDAMYTTNFYKTISPRPDPAKTDLSYKTTYHQNLTNVKNEIKAEMEAKKSIIDKGALKADLGINELRASSAVLFLVLEKAKNIISNVSVTLAEVEKNLTKAGGSTHDAIGIGGTVVPAIFGGNVAFGIIASVATVISIVSVIGAHFAGKFVHLSWCAITSLTVIGWFLVATLAPTGIILFEVCDVGYQVLDNATFFNITMDKFVVHNTTDGTETENGPMVKDLLYTCYYGDGNLIAALNLSGVLGIFGNVFQPLDNIANLSTSMGPVPDSYVIPREQKLVEQYKTGMIPDSPIATEDLNKLNTLTNFNTFPCTQVKDTWVLNSTQCATGSGTVFNDTSAADFNLYSPTCIGFDAWNGKPIKNRYNMNSYSLTGCAAQGGFPASTYLQTFVSNFDTARKDVKSTFTDLGSSLNTVSNANSLYMKSVKLATAAFDPVRTATNKTYTAMWDPVTGFIRNADCNFFRQATRDILDSTCSRFGNSLAKTTRVLIVSSFFGFVAGILLFCLAFKFLRRKAGEAFDKLNEEGGHA